MALSVAQWCQQKQMTAQSLSDAARLDPSRVDAIVQGRWTPSPTERERIATSLGVTVEDIAWGHVTPIQHLYGHGPG